MAGGAGFEGNMTGRRGQDLGVMTGNQQAETAHDAAIWGMVGTGVGMASRGSDRRMKTDVAPVGVDDFGARLSRLSAPSAPARAPGGSAALDTARQTPMYRYTYTTPRDPSELGPQTGIMAQDLAKTPLGREAISPGPDGMARIDTGKAALISLGAVNDLNAKIDALLAKSRGPNAEMAGYAQ
jgi:hypothetical protein